MIKNLAVEPDEAGAKVSFVFELTTPACPVRDQFKRQAETVVAAIPGVSSVDVTMSANVRQNGANGRGQVELPGVKNLIAVGSGKGGVGKSTVAANLATALAATGAKVGLLDADVYGPSVPQLMGVHESARVAERKIVPHEAHGVKLMSLGFLTQDDRPVIWRGPMVGQAVKQLLSDVNWGDLDYLLVDLPPGTGDAPLTLIQSIPLSGIVVVTTPQDVALGIATKTLTMFRSLNVPILGIIENMSGFECPNCGHHSHIFSEGGGKATAEALKVPFLGALPLDETVRQGGDDGVPAPVGAPDSAAGRLFSDVARKLAAQVSIRSAMSFSLAVK
jgi:ATP-binding protein involved in chromosome partitioning